MASSQGEYKIISPEYMNNDTPDERRLHIVRKLKDTKYKMLVDTGATNSYIIEQFFEQLKKLNYEIIKPINDKLIVANWQGLKIIGQVLIPIEFEHVGKCLLFRLAPELRSIGILGTDMIKKLGLKLDFENKNLGGIGKATN